jgi:hypothetical protein
VLSCLQSKTMSSGQGQAFAFVVTVGAWRSLVPDKSQAKLLTRPHISTTSTKLATRFNRTLIRQSSLKTTNSDRRRPHKGELLEHTAHNRGVAGSSPALATYLYSRGASTTSVSRGNGLLEALTTFDRVCRDSGVVQARSNRILIIV